MLTALFGSAFVIALAELGDKTQILALMLACRYKAWQVIVGVFGATLLVHLISTVVGQLLGIAIPAKIVAVVAGVAFVGFGVWTLKGDKVDEDAAAKPSRYGPILASGIAFFLAELGDKTQLATITLAGRYAAQPGMSAAAAFWGVWMGSTIGMVVADGLAIFVGAVLGKKLPERLITRISGVLFIVVGIYMLAGAFVKLPGVS
jgi:putative Ca2+/H+ antiporter (TMEM165/GDT1 family)